MNSRSKRKIRMLRSLVRPASRNFPPCLLVQEMQDRVPVSSIDETRAHSVVCERLPVSSVFW